MSVASSLTLRVEFHSHGLKDGGKLEGGSPEKKVCTGMISSRTVQEPFRLIGSALALPLANARTVALNCHTLHQRFGRMTPPLPQRSRSRLILAANRVATFRSSLQPS